MTPGGLTAFVAAVSMPGNALSQHFLTPAQSWARFGALPDVGAKVSAWVKANGLAITDSSKHYVALRGTPAQVGSAFGTTFHSFTVNGKTVHAPTGSVSVPASLTADVLTVTGLSSQLVANKPVLVGSSQPGLSSTAAKPATTTTPAKPDAKAFPCAAYEGQKIAKKYPRAYGLHQPFAVCGYGPQQLAGAYGATDSGFTGKGITVAVVDGFALPTVAKDLDQWNKNRGWQQMKKGEYTEDVPAGTGYSAGWAGEEALDVEAIHSMAPDANILYAAAKTPSDNYFIDAFNRIIDGGLADAVNNSWEGGTDAGVGQATITAFENVFKMGATTGVGFYFSTGDGGGAGGTLYPSVDPYVTGVGGTAIGINKHNGYMWETDWETDYTAISQNGKKWDPAPPGTFQSGTGGGTSVVFKQPKWQKGVVPKKFSEANGKTPMRTTPDIAAEADPTTGFLEGYSTQTGGTFVYAETASAAPACRPRSSSACRPLLSRPRVARPSASPTR